MSEVESMFAPLYASAARLGVAPADLDRSELHVVRWMLEDPAARRGGRLDATTEASVRAQRVAAARGEAERPQYQPFDPGAVGIAGRV